MKKFANRSRRTARSTTENPIPASFVLALTRLYLDKLYRPDPPLDPQTQRTLILAVALVIIVLILALIGAPDVIESVLQHWPLLP